MFCWFLKILNVLEKNILVLSYDCPEPNFSPAYSKFAEINKVKKIKKNIQVWKI